jgi:GntR family transcriptional repressor for pyruvate dehydrogenase complex
VRSSAEGIGALALLEESESVENALDARRVVERGVVELAIDRANEEQIEAIAKIWEKMRAALKEKNYEDFFELNERFHLAIAAATGNPLIVKVINLLLRVTRQKLWKQTITEYFLKDESHFKQSIEEHRRILTALSSKDKEMARRVMEEHFISVEQILQED